MSLSIARQVRDLRTDPVQWYHGAPDSPAAGAALRTTLRALRAAKALEGARIGIVGGLAMTVLQHGGLDQRSCGSASASRSPITTSAS